MLLSLPMNARTRQYLPYPPQFLTQPTPTDGPCNQRIPPNPTDAAPPNPRQKQRAPPSMHVSQTHFPAFPPSPHPQTSNADPKKRSPPSAKSQRRTLHLASNDIAQLDPVLHRHDEADGLVLAWGKRQHRQRHISTSSTGLWPSCMCVFRHVVVRTGMDSGPLKLFLETSPLPAPTRRPFSFLIQGPRGACRRECAAKARGGRAPGLLIAVLRDISRELPPLPPEIGRPTGRTGGPPADR